ncbi:hypothetical protein A2U01_0006163 [Trifolium medium]|uniref:Uncharacterized protein n=1 Tax=Trifolium medium TaxID=97028 RepID=A0A392ME42_9FABA|nr:hypothetical protein [Trifolium medium]
MDYGFDEHIVTFNKDESHPLLMDGWHEMKEVFDLHQNEEIHIAYYGKMFLLLWRLQDLDLKIKYQTFIADVLLLEQGIELWSYIPSSAPISTEPINDW